VADPRPRTDPPPSARQGADAAFVLDIGGTWTRAAHWPLISEASVTKVRTPSRTNDPEKPAGELVDQLIDLIVELVPERAPSTVAISLGAALDHRRGVVYGSAPLWGESTTDVPIAARLHARNPQVHWVVMNDVTAMLAAYRAAHPELATARIVVVTISSGIAARCDDPASRTLPTDPAGLQGEIGHLPATTNDLHLRCACGELDHVAAFASGPGLRAVARSLAERTPPAVPANRVVDLDPAAFERTFAQALDADDAFAHRVLDEAARPLADVFTYLLTTHPDTERIVMTGGVVDAVGPHYRRAVLRRMQQRGVHHTARQHPTWLDSVLVLTLSPDETSPLVGAALLAAGRLEGAS
jgi:glucokinase